MAAQLNTVMGTLASALGSVSGLRVTAFPPASAQPPFAFVAPESIDYDGAMARGMDRMSLSVYVGVANVIDRAAWNAVTGYATYASVKAALDGIGQNYRVQRVVFQEIDLASGTYLGAVFLVDVAA